MTDRIEWSLVASNGTTIKVKDVSIAREVAEAPSMDNPGLIMRRLIGPARVTAVVIGTEPEEQANAYRGD